MLKNEKIIEDLLKRLPPLIDKYKSFSTTHQYLKDILDFLKVFKDNKKPMDPLEKAFKDLSNKKEIVKETLKNTYKLINQ